MRAPPASAAWLPSKAVDTRTPPADSTAMPPPTKALLSWKLVSRISSSPANTSRRAPPRPFTHRVPDCSHARSSGAGPLSSRLAPAELEVKTESAMEAESQDASTAPPDTAVLPTKVLRVISRWPRGENATPPPTLFSNEAWSITRAREDTPDNTTIAGTVVSAAHPVTLEAVRATSTPSPADRNPATPSQVTEAMRREAVPAEAMAAAPRENVLPSMAVSAPWEDTPPSTEENEDDCTRRAAPLEAAATTPAEPPWKVHPKIAVVTSRAATPKSTSVKVVSRMMATAPAPVGEGTRSVAAGPSVTTTSPASSRVYTPRSGVRGDGGGSMAVISTPGEQSGPPATQAAVRSTVQPEIETMGRAPSTRARAAPPRALQPSRLTSASCASTPTPAEPSKTTPEALMRPPGPTQKAWAKAP
mmetsp:Transcript_11128/g.35302  ORF Transcript_11128/g.35302 Transcript_11128/m.35302 type:complete len:418 (+) Transcript_11128:4585-5838(+)